MFFSDDSDDVPIIQSVASLVLDAPISCLAFVPNHAKMFIIGTYELLEEDNQLAESSVQGRTGSIRAFNLKDDSM